MQTLTLVHYWMLGVMLVMAIFGGVAIYGYYYRLKQDQQSDVDK